MDLPVEVLIRSLDVPQIIISSPLTWTGDGGKGENKNHGKIRKKKSISVASKYRSEKH